MNDKENDVFRLDSQTMRIELFTALRTTSPHCQCAEQVNHLRQMTKDVQHNVIKITRHMIMKNQDSIQLREICHMK